MSKLNEKLVLHQTVYLRAIEPDDAVLLYKWYNDDQVNFGSNMKTVPYSLDQLRNDIVRGTYSSQTRVGLIATVEDLPIGMGTIYTIDRINRKAEVGIMIAETDFWNKGYATKIGYDLLRICFEGLGLNRVYCSAYEYNRASALLLATMGLTFEGVIRESYFRGDKFWDKSIYSILALEWYERREDLRHLAGVTVDC
ncbi:MAG: GNAT family N-acetyltransferase [Symbiobacteriaceae bacterium]|nr:GNAT family N-acetyltransferase [Symbiobacteriaceae bacterium]